MEYGRPRSFQLQLSVKQKLIEKKHPIKKAIPTSRNGLCFRTTKNINLLWQQLPEAPLLSLLS